LSNGPPPIARLAPLLPQLVAAFRRRAGEIPAVLQPVGRLGERHIAVMMSLAIVGPAAVSDLGKRLGMSTAHSSLIVGELARAGLVEREHDPQDRRRVVVRLADAARPAVAEMRSRVSKPLISFLGELSAQDAEQFIAHLRQLINHLRDEPPAPGAPLHGSSGLGAAPRLRRAPSIDAPNPDRHD
jgi:DNA-binding MarR family transcriptional regulator